MADDSAVLNVQAPTPPLVQTEPNVQLGYSIKDSMFGSRDRMILVSLAALGIGCLVGIVMGFSDLREPFMTILGAFAMAFNGGSRGPTTNGKG
jgi:ABC-type nitrate/sulfonate/bicarbonate transport system permease component